jgi:hypothetical protein
MYRFVPVFLIAAGALQLAEAQQTIQWRTDVPGAVNTSKQTRLPLMFYVLGRNEDRDDKLDNAQKRAFTDPRVLRLSHRFITTRLSRSVNRDVLEELKLPPTMTQEIAFVTPDGQVIDRLSPSGVADSNSLAEKMKLVFEAYRKQLLTKEIQPEFEKPDAPVENLRIGLAAIRDLHIVSADAAILKLLERENLNRQVEVLAYDVLASLATKPGMQKLMDLSIEGKPHADEALGQTTPVGAEILAENMVADDGTVHVAFYNAICKVCDIKGRKTQKWWERSEERLLKEEIARTQTAAKEAAAQWKAMNDE